MTPTYILFLDLRHACKIQLGKEGTAESARILKSNLLLKL